MLRSCDRLEGCGEEKRSHSFGIELLCEQKWRGLGGGNFCSFLFGRKIGLKFLLNLQKQVKRKSILLYQKFC